MPWYHDSGQLMKKCDSLKISHLFVLKIWSLDFFHEGSRLWVLKSTLCV